MSKPKQVTLFQSWGQKTDQSNPQVQRNTSKPSTSSCKGQNTFIDLCDGFDDSDEDDELLLQAEESIHGNELNLHDHVSDPNIEGESDDINACDISIGTDNFTPTQQQVGGVVQGFDRSAGKLWIYPTNYSVRDYQFNIVKQCLFKNTMVTLPTGLGKTFIAAVAMYNYYRWYPQGKVIFMAPTKPLVAQQIEACYNIMGIPQTDTAEMTGNMGPSKREATWHEKRVFFLTPQVLTNDLGRGSCPGESVRCLVIDEAHKALGNHAYCQVVRELVKYTENFRVLALSATPGSDIKAVQQVLSNLLISHIEIRTEESPDIKQYSHERKVDKIVVPLGDELTKVKTRYICVMDVVVAKLKRNGVLYNRETTSLSKFLILKAREAFRQNPPDKLQRGQYGFVEGDFALAMSLYHGYELLQLHGSRSLYNFLEGTISGDKGYGRTRTELMKIGDFTELMKFLADKYKKNPSGEEQGKDNKLVIGHPKMEQLQDIVVEHFQKFARDKVETRVMIFSQYRDSVQEITTMLQVHRPLVKVMSFIGQSSAGKATKGFTQKEQLMVMKKFREGGYNTLVSTCVGEEGLDIGDVDLIICFDAHKSPIRLVQRMGRTGRKREGRIVMLVTEGKEEQIYNQSQYSKKSIHKAILNGAQSLHFYQHSPAMVPDNVTPTPHKMFITVKESFKPTRKASVETEQRKAFTHPGSTNEGKQNPLQGEHLTLDQYKELMTDWHVPTENVPTLPESDFICLQPSDQEGTEDEGSYLSLCEWLPWQNQLQSTDLLDHSMSARHLVEMMEFIEIHHAMSSDDDPYGQEMATFLNMDDVVEKDINQTSILNFSRNFQGLKNKNKVTPVAGNTAKMKKKSRRSDRLLDIEIVDERKDSDEELPPFDCRAAVQDTKIHSEGETDVEPTYNNNGSDKTQTGVNRHTNQEVTVLVDSDDGSTTSNKPVKTSKSRLSAKQLTQTKRNSNNSKRKSVVKKVTKSSKSKKSKQSIGIRTIVELIAHSDASDFDQVEPSLLDGNRTAECAMEEDGDVVMKINSESIEEQEEEKKENLRFSQLFPSTYRLPTCVTVPVYEGRQMFDIPSPPPLEEVDTLLADLIYDDSLSRLDLLMLVEEWQRENETSLKTKSLLQHTPRISNKCAPRETCQSLPNLDQHWDTDGQSVDSTDTLNHSKHRDKQNTNSIGGKTKKRLSSELCDTSISVDNPSFMSPPQQLKYQSPKVKMTVTEFEEPTDQLPNTVSNMDTSSSVKIPWKDKRTERDATCLTVDDETYSHAKLHKEDGISKDLGYSDKDIDTCSEGFDVGRSKVTVETLTENPQTPDVVKQLVRSDLNSVILSTRKKPLFPTGDMMDTQKRQPSSVGDMMDEPGEDSWLCDDADADLLKIVIPPAQTQFTFTQALAYVHSSSQSSGGESDIVDNDDHHDGDNGSGDDLGEPKSHNTKTISKPSGVEKNSFSKCNNSSEITVHEDIEIDTKSHTSTEDEACFHMSPDILLSEPEDCSVVAVSEARSVCGTVGTGMEVEKDKTEDTRSSDSSTTDELPQFDLGFDLDADIIPPSPTASQKPQKPWGGILMQTMSNCLSQSRLSTTSQVTVVEGKKHNVTGSSSLDKTAEGKKDQISESASLIGQCKKKRVNLFSSKVNVDTGSCQESEITGTAVVEIADIAGKVKEAKKLDGKEPDKLATIPEAELSFNLLDDDLSSWIDDVDCNTFNTQHFKCSDANMAAEAPMSGNKTKVQNKAVPNTSDVEWEDEKVERSLLTKTPFGKTKLKVKRKKSSRGSFIEKSVFMADEFSPDLLQDYSLLNLSAAVKTDDEPSPVVCRSGGRSASTPLIGKTSVNFTSPIARVSPLGNKSLNLSHVGRTTDNISDQDDSFIIRPRKKKVRVLTSPFSQLPVNKTDAKSPATSFTELQSRSSCSKRSDTSGSTTVSVSVGSLSRQNLSIDDNNSDDDFDDSSLLPQKKFNMKKRKAVLEDKSDDNVEKRTKLKTGKAKRGTNPFIEEEAEESEDCTGSGDDSDHSHLDQYEASFIQDFSQQSQAVNTTDMHAVYLESIKSPTVAGRGQFKLQYNYRDDIDVFSQMPQAEEEESQYLEDSFCVGDEEDYDEEDYKTENHGEITVMGTLQEGVGGRQRRTGKALETGRQRTLHRNRLRALDEIRSRVCGRKSKQKEPSTEPVPTTRKTNFCDSVKHGKRGRVRRLQDSSSEEEHPSEIQKLHISATTTTGRTKRNKIEFLLSSDEEDDDVPVVPTNTENILVVKGDLHNKPAAPTMAIAGSMSREERLLKQKQKQEEFRRKMKDRSSTCTTSINNGSLNSSSDSDLTKLKDRLDVTNTEENVSKSAKLMANTCTSNTDNKTKTLDQTCRDPDLITSSTLGSSKDKEKRAILVDSKEISGCQDVVSSLRFKHNVHVSAASLAGCDYILSNRMAVERKSWSEFSNGSNRTKMVERMQHLADLYDRPCLIVEKDRVKTGEEKSARPQHWTKYVDRTLALLVRSEVKVFFTDSQCETAALLSDMCCQEARKGQGIIVPTDLSADKQNCVKFYTTIPGISYVQALNLAHTFNQISDLVVASVGLIQRKGQMSANRATELYKYCRRQFDTAMLPTKFK